MWRRGYVSLRIAALALALALALGLGGIPGAACAAAAAAGLAAPAVPGGPPAALRRELDRAEAQLHRSLQAPQAGPAPQILREPGRVVLRIPASLLFDAESTIPRADAPARALLILVRRLLLKRERLGVQIEVYTDGIGGAEPNRQLAQRRAEALLTWLSGEGVPATRLHASGRGPSAPLASDENAEGRARNRRVEFGFEPAPIP
jgi:outer membrane protein OmpA-like peptidoglycan-associated protein